MFRFSECEDEAFLETKFAYRYQRALKEAQNKPITIPLVEKICSTIHDKPMWLRSQYVRIGNRYHTVYVPPDKKPVIKKLLENWVKQNETFDFDPLIQMAILHSQFEAIHPFIDGNGRSGRILILLFLIKKKVLNEPFLCLSKFLMENRQRYYSLLTKVTEKKNWKGWILYMLDGVEKTSLYTIKLSQELKKLKMKTREKLKDILNETYDLDSVTEFLFTYPVCENSHFLKLAKKDKNPDLKDLSKLLVDHAVLKDKKLFFVNEEYLKLITTSIDE